jgi:hypothetical protein
MSPGQRICPAVVSFYVEYVTRANTQGPPTKSITGIVGAFASEGEDTGAEPRPGPAGAPDAAAP